MYLLLKYILWNHKWGISAFCFTRKFFCYRNPQITDGQLNIPKMGFHNQSSVKSFRVISSTVYFFTIFCFELDLTRGQEVGRISYRKVSLHKHKYYPREVQSNCISLISLQFIILHCPSLSVSHSFNFPNHFPYPSLSYTHTQSFNLVYRSLCVSLQPTLTFPPNILHAPLQQRKPLSQALLYASIASLTFFLFFSLSVFLLSEQFGALHFKALSDLRLPLTWSYLKQKRNSLCTWSAWGNRVNTVLQDKGPSFNPSCHYFSYRTTGESLNSWDLVNQ